MRKVVKSDEICYTVLVMIEKRTDKNSTLPRTKAHISKANYLTQLRALGKIRSLAASQPRSLARCRFSPPSMAEYKSRERL